MCCYVVFIATEESDKSNLGAGAASGDANAGHGAAEENRGSRLWRSVVIGEQEHRIDMKCIDSYKRVISHGGMQIQILKIHTFLFLIAFVHLYSLLRSSLLIRPAGGKQ